MRTHIPLAAHEVRQLARLTAIMRALAVVSVACALVVLALRS